MKNQSIRETESFLSMMVAPCFYLHALRFASVSPVWLGCLVHWQNLDIRLPLEGFPFSKPDFFLTVTKRTSDKKLILVVTKSYATCTFLEQVHRS